MTVFSSAEGQYVSGVGRRPVSSNEEAVCFGNKRPIAISASAEPTEGRSPRNAGAAIHR